MIQEEDKPWSAGVRPLRDDEKKRLGGALGDVDKWLIITTEPLVAYGHQYNYVGEPGQQRRITAIKTRALNNGIWIDGKILSLTGDFFRTTVIQRNPRGDIAFNENIVMVLAKVV